jgi:hypothetical protein
MSFWCVIFKCHSVKFLQNAIPNSVTVIRAYFHNCFILIIVLLLAYCHSYNCHRAECRGAIFGVASTLQKNCDSFKTKFWTKMSQVVFDSWSWQNKNILSCAVYFQYWVISNKCFIVLVNLKTRKVCLKVSVVCSVRMAQIFKVKLQKLYIYILKINYSLLCMLFFSNCIMQENIFTHPLISK